MPLRSRALTACRFAALMLVCLGAVTPLTLAQTTAPGIVNSWSLGDRSKKGYGRISGGGSAEILNGVAMNAVLSTSIGRDDGNDVSAQVGLNVGL